MTDYFIKYRSSSVRCKLVLINQSLGQRIIMKRRPIEDHIWRWHLSWRTTSV